MDLFTEDDKNRVGKRLTLLLADFWEKQTLTQTEVAEASQFILNNIHTINNKDDLLVFLQNLSQKYPPLSQVLEEEKLHYHEDNSQKKVEEIESLMRENKVNEALQVSQNEQKEEVN